VECTFWTNSWNVWPLWSRVQLHILGLTLFYIMKTAFLVYEWLRVEVELKGIINSIFPKPTNEVIIHNEQNCAWLINILFFSSSQMIYVMGWKAPEEQYKDSDSVGREFSWEGELSSRERENCSVKTSDRKEEWGRELLSVLRTLSLVAVLWCEKLRVWQTNLVDIRRSRYSSCG